MSDGKFPVPWVNPRFTSSPFSIWHGNTQIASLRWEHPNPGWAVNKVAPECIQDEKEAKDVAERIVLAVNAHDALVAALNAVADYGVPQHLEAQVHAARKLARGEA